MTLACNPSKWTFPWPTWPSWSSDCRTPALAMTSWKMCRTGATASGWAFCASGATTGPPNSTSRSPRPSSINSRNSPRKLRASRLANCLKYLNTFSHLPCADPLSSRQTASTGCLSPRGSPPAGPWLARRCLRVLPNDPDADRPQSTPNGLGSGLWGDKFSY